MHCRSSQNSYVYHLHSQRNAPQCNAFTIYYHLCNQNHVAVGRVVTTLEETFQQPLVHDTVLKAYLHFEAMCDHSYKYSCVQCGYYPPVLIMDLNKKGVFKLAGTESCMIFTLRQFIHQKYIA